MSEYNRQHNPFLDSIELSVRADRLLRAWGRVKSIEDFLNLKRSEFMALKGAGVKTWKEIVLTQRMFLREEMKVVPAEPASPQSLSLRDAAALTILYAILSSQGLRIAAEDEARKAGATMDQTMSNAAYRLADAVIAAREAKTDD